MNRSRVFTNLNFLASLREVRGRRQLLQNMTSAQTKAVCEVAKRIVDGTINPLRRDAQTFDRKRTVLRTLASDRVNVARKKQVLKRHTTLLHVLLHERYVVLTIIDETRIAGRALEQ